MFAPQGGPASVIKSQESSLLSQILNMAETNDLTITPSLSQNSDADTTIPYSDLDNTIPYNDSDQQNDLDISDKTLPYKTCYDRHLKIGTFNVQGLKTARIKLSDLANDAQKYKLDIIAIQETHYLEQTIQTIKTNSGRTYLLYKQQTTPEANQTGLMVDLVF